MSEPITISEEARTIAYKEIVNDTAKDFMYRQTAVGHHVQLAINSATAPLLARIKELEIQRDA